MNSCRNTVIMPIPRKFIKTKVFHPLLHVLHGIPFNLKYVFLLIHQKFTFYHSLVYMNIYILKETWRNAAGLRHKNICAIYYLARNYKMHKNLIFYAHSISLTNIISFKERQKHAHQFNPCWRKSIILKNVLKINFHILKWIHHDYFGLFPLIDKLQRYFTFDNITLLMQRQLNDTKTPQLLNASLCIWHQKNLSHCYIPFAKILKTQIHVTSFPYLIVGNYYVPTSYPRLRKL